MVRPIDKHKHPLWKAYCFATLGVCYSVVVGLGGLFLLNSAPGGNAETVVFNLLMSPFGWLVRYFFPGNYPAVYATNVIFWGFAMSGATVYWWKPSKKSPRGFAPIVDQSEK